MYEKDPLSKSLIEAAGKVLRRELVDEAWDTNYQTPENKKGMWDGWSESDLKAEYDKLKAKENKSDAETTRMKEVGFALRAKHDWGKVESVQEAEMSDAQMKKREEIVKSMKEKEAEFKSKYGDRWKEVMYATATKMAMNEELNEARFPRQAEYDKASRNMEKLLKEVRKELDNMYTYAVDDKISNKAYAIKRTFDDIARRIEELP